MADFRFVKCQYWVDPYTATLTVTESHYYLWLITNPHTNQCGMIDVSDSTKSTESRLTLDEIQAAESRLERDGKIKRHGGMIWIVNFHRHQSTRSPAIATRIIKELRPLGPSHPLAKLFIAKYPDAADYDALVSPDLPSEKRNEIKKNEILTVRGDRPPTPSPPTVPNKGENRKYDPIAASKVGQNRRRRLSADDIAKYRPTVEREIRQSLAERLSGTELDDAVKSNADQWQRDMFAQNNITTGETH